MSEYNINTQWTLLERAKRSVDGKTILPLLDVMDERGVPDFLRDAPYFEANQGLKHRVIRTTSHPSSTRRRFYAGVGATKMDTQVIYEDLVLFEQRSEVDEDHLDTLANPKEARRQEDEGHIAGLLEDVVYAIFRDAKTSGAEYFDGFAARCGSLKYPGGSTETLPFCWDAGGSALTGYLCSMWFVEWGPGGCYMLYPSGGAVQGGQFGIIARDKGKEPKADSDDSTATYYAYVSQFKKWCGLACENDWKFCRIANIPRDESQTGAWTENLVIKAINHGKFNTGRTRCYVNPFLKAQIDMKANAKNNVIWQTANVFGQPTMTVCGIPIRVLDETILPSTETAIS